MDICPHCKMNIRIRNPSGFCDHLYYPYYCQFCTEAIKMSLRQELDKSDKDIKLRQLKKRVEVLIHKVEVLQEKLRKLENAYQPN